jgi:hypothetical protein
MSDIQAPAAGGQGGAPAAASAAPAPAAAPAAPAIEWLSGADEVTVGLVQNKGWKSPNDVVQSYTQLEKFVGAPADKIVRLPTETSTKEDLDAFYNKLGRPADAKGYELPVPEGQPRDFADKAAAKFHELGLTKSQAKVLTEWYNGEGAAVTQAQQEAKAQTNIAQQQALKKEWGAGYDAQMSTARLGMQAFGVDGDTIDKLQDALGYDGAMKFMANLGAKAGEGSFHGGGNGNFNGAMTPGQAQAEIKSLQADKEWTAKYLAGNKEAKDRMAQLMKWAHP